MPPIRFGIKKTVRKKLVPRNLRVSNHAKRKAKMLTVITETMTTRTVKPKAEMKPSRWEKASTSRKMARTPEIPKVIARTMRISARMRCGESETVMRIGNLKDVAKKPSEAAGHRLT